MHSKVIRIASLAAGAIAALFGGWTPGLTILSVMMAVDYLTGVLVAITGKSPKSAGGGLSSKAGFTGIARKGFIRQRGAVHPRKRRAHGRAHARRPEKAAGDDARRGTEGQWGNLNICSIYKSRADCYNGCMT